MAKAMVYNVEYVNCEGWCGDYSADTFSLAMAMYIAARASKCTTESAYYVTESLVDYDYTESCICGFNGAHTVATFVGGHTI